MTTNASKTEITAVTAEAILKRHDYGGTHPTLIVKTQTTTAICALRHNRAAGLRAAAEVELALANLGEENWSVNNPRWGDEQRLANAWSTVFEIWLEGNLKAQANLAMKALEAVAAKLNGLARE